MKETTKHFEYTFWFIVGITGFGALFTVFLVFYLPPPASERVADTALIFWLSTAVAGGIGYLLGSNAQQAKKAGNEIVLPASGTENKTTITSEPATQNE